MNDFCNESSNTTGSVIVNEFIAATFIATPLTGEAPLLVNFSNTSNPTDVVSYDWDFGNGLNQITNSPISLNSTYTVSGEYTVSLTATNNIGCTHTASQIISVFSLPEVSAPNVFTPNGDGVNDVFELYNYKNIALFECTILNRWGNVLTTFDDITEYWDGNTKSGAPANEGVYFYKYKAESKSGKTVSGHGFFHLVRD